MKKALLSFASLAVVAGSVFAVEPMGAEMIPAIPGGFGTVAYGVNDTGTVVGQADNASGTLVAFVYSLGVTEELPMLTNGLSAQAQGVNNNGVIVGFCNVDGGGFGISRPVKWVKVDGVWTVTDLGTLRDDDTGFGVAQRINDAGVIVGYSTRQDGNSYHGTIWNTDGTTTDSGTLGFGGNFAYSQLLGINQAGDVTGFAYATLQGPEHGLYMGFGQHAEDITPPGGMRPGPAQWHNVTDEGVLGGYIGGPMGNGEFRPAIYTSRDGYVLAPQLEGLEGGYGYDINNGRALVGTMFHLEEDPTLSIFRAFVYQGGETTDLNLVATGIVGTMTEARDIANSGLIVGNCESGLGVTQAVLLYPLPPACAGDVGSAGGEVGADGVLDNNDFIVFINWFFEQDGRADVGVAGGEHGHDGLFDNNDFIAYIDSFFAGCI